jgi:RluA family pseudouridine synthase
VAKPTHIELGRSGVVIPILYEDRSVLAVDKPAGWLLAPDSWDQTGRNLQLALQSSLNAGDFWARSRNLKYLRFVHRLDADTTGVLLFAKSPGALRALSELFESRGVHKIYLAVVHGRPKQNEWSCTLPLVPDPSVKGRMRTAPQRSRHDAARDAETHFKLLNTGADTALVEARPVTGRTHQIRVHLVATGHPVVGDALYSSSAPATAAKRQPLALRAISLEYREPFRHRTIRIRAPFADFVRNHGFPPALAGE